ncbi:unnamed protein product [Cylicostephanus goldi]|uniref:Uncharacterized protein n=1 Tax=Cylicostephanus goldi TaxID=71465 RepID=A0A3P6T7L8_CYLGO|nr:unnamed protein product [Cylicostephanus goldi]
MERMILENAERQTSYRSRAKECKELPISAGDSLQGKVWCRSPPGFGWTGAENRLDDQLMCGIDNRNPNTQAHTNTVTLHTNSIQCGSYCSRKKRVLHHCSGVEMPKMGSGGEEGSEQLKLLLASLHGLREVEALQEFGGSETIAELPPRFEAAGCRWLAMSVLYLVSMWYIQGQSLPVRINMRILCILCMVLGEGDYRGSCFARFPPEFNDFWTQNLHDF